VLRAADGAVWVTGLRPRGKGFSLDIGARVDTGPGWKSSGVVREGKGWSGSRGNRSRSPSRRSRRGMPKRRPFSRWDRRPTSSSAIPARERPMSR
jgi:hypothetical protein